MFVGLQEETTSRKSTVKAGGETGDVCGDVREDTRCGLVVVRNLKQNTKGPLIVSLSFAVMPCIKVVKRKEAVSMLWPTLVTVLDSSQIVKPAQSTSPLV